jgi:hypothetical protein
MASIVPLYNAQAQTRVDFNNQTPTNGGGLFRYRVIDYGSGNRTLNVNDFNSVLVFSGDVTISFGTDTFSNVTPPIGTEIIFLSVSGYARLAPAVGTTLFYENGAYTPGPNAIGKIIHMGSNSWLFASPNIAVKQFDLPNCCSGTTSIFQLSAAVSFASAPIPRTYANSILTVPFNGTVQLVDSMNYYAYIFQNGYNTSTLYNECPQFDYSTSYSFYSGPDPVYDGVTFYSVDGLTPSTKSTLSGHKFFTASQGTKYDCAEAFDGTVVSPGSPTNYYASVEAYPGTPILFLNGYVINI